MTIWWGPGLANLRTVCLSPPRDPEVGRGGRSPSLFSSQGLCLGLTDWETTLCLCTRTALSRNPSSPLGEHWSQPHTQLQSSPPGTPYLGPSTTTPLSLTVRPPSDGGPKRVRSPARTRTRGLSLAAKRLWGWGTARG